MIRNAVTFLIGAGMAAGFGLAGVARPETIVNFLDFFGAWDPSVMAVMGAAVAVTFVMFRLIGRRGAPLFEPKFSIPTRRDIDARLIVGAALFGLGWGLVGLCPGPALASIATGDSRLLVWLAAVVGGMFLFKPVDKWLAARSLATSERTRPETRTPPAPSLTAS